VGELYVKDGVGAIRQNDERPWIDYATPCDDKDLALFQASTNIKLGNEKNVVFWHDK
jgi:hypothetical protein